MQQVIQYIVTLSIFIVIDALWLGFVAKNFYAHKLGFLMRKKPIWWAALLFYMIAVLGILVFVLPLATSLTSAFYFGALFGVVTYSTYDLTNYSTIDKWELGLVIVDITWGAIFLGTVSLITYWIF